MSYRYQKPTGFTSEFYFMMVFSTAVISFILYVILRDYLYLIIPISFVISFIYFNAKKDISQYLEIDETGINYCYVNFLLRQIHPTLRWENVASIEVIIRQSDRYFVIQDNFGGRYYLPGFGYNYSEAYLNLVKYATESNPNIKLEDWRENKLIGLR